MSSGVLWSNSDDGRRSKPEMDRAAATRSSDSVDEVPVRRLVLVRSSAADAILDSTLDYRLDSLVDVKDDGLTDFTVARVLMRVCYSSLTSLRLVDCPLLQLGDETAEMLTSLPLSSLDLPTTPNANPNLKLALVRSKTPKPPWL